MLSQYALILYLTCKISLQLVYNRYILVLTDPVHVGLPPAQHHVSTPLYSDHMM